MPIASVSEEVKKGECDPPAPVRIAADRGCHGRRGLAAGGPRVLPHLASSHSMRHHGAVLLGLGRAEGSGTLFRSAPSAPGPVAGQESSVSMWAAAAGWVGP
jgi:hypothetical protein